MPARNLAIHFQQHCHFFLSPEALSEYREPRSRSSSTNASTYPSSMPDVIDLRRIRRNRQLRLRAAPTRRRRPQSRHTVDAKPVTVVGSGPQRRAHPGNRRDARFVDLLLYLLVQRRVGMVLDRRCGGRGRQRPAGGRAVLAGIARIVGLFGLEASFGPPAERLYREKTGRHSGGFVSTLEGRSEESWGRSWRGVCSLGNATPSRMKASVVVGRSFSGVRKVLRHVRLAMLIFLEKEEKRGNQKMACRGAMLVVLREG